MHRVPNITPKCSRRKSLSYSWDFLKISHKLLPHDRSYYVMVKGNNILSETVSIPTILSTV